MVSAHLNLFKAIVIIGPTASGKTKLAHTLFDEFVSQGKRVAIINMDAFQIYKGFDIGTAKPSLEERKRYNYELVDILEPHESLDAREFANMARRICLENSKKDIMSICVGGSGLYLRAFLHGLDDLPQRNDELRNFMRGFAERWGWPSLHNWLKNIDPVRASELHPNDKTRVERALEIFWLTGKPASEQRSKTEALKSQQDQFESFVIQVDGSDEFLKERTRTRTFELLDSGWVEEVRHLFALHGDALRVFSAFRAIGYAEILASLKDENEFQQDTFRQLLVTKTWQYVRRQRTWNAKERCDYLFSWENSSVDEAVQKVKMFEFSQSMS